MKHFANLIVTVTVLIISGAHALADSDFLTPTPVKSDLECQDLQSDSILAIQFPTHGQKAKIWLMTEADKTVGLPLDVLDFKVARCPGCFFFKAKFVDTEMLGNANGFNLTVLAHDIGSSGQPETFQYLCAPSQAQ